MSGSIEKPSQLLLNPGWPAFISPSVAKVKWPDGSTWWLKPCSLMGWLWVYWLLSYYSTFGCCFPTILFLSGFACFQALPLHLSMMYIHTNSSNPHQLQGIPIWHLKRMFRCWTLKVENLLVSARALIKPTKLFQNRSTGGRKKLVLRKPHDIFVWCWISCNFVLPFIINPFSCAYNC